MGDAYSHGAEIEGRYFLSGGLALTGSYSLARGYLRAIPTGVDVNGVSQLLDGAVTNARREWLNYPHHIWNIGADLILRPRHSLNATLRGWRTMNIVAAFDAPLPGAYAVLPGEASLDVTYLAKNLRGGFDLRLSAGNLFDNTEPVGMVINNGVFHPRGRNLGVQLSKRF
jgi:outer membrane receptor protein involved in Fe transport